MKVSEEIKEPNAKIWWGVAIPVCIAICVVGFILTQKLTQLPGVFPVKNDDCASALFGDSFGAVNALVSALAFACMIVTFVLQRYELSMQRRELEAQRMEINQQNETLRLQRFENTFFSMMEVQQSIVNDFYAKDTYKENIEEDNPQDCGRLSKEIVVPREYSGRNIFYYVFIICKHFVGKNNDDYKIVDGLCGLLTTKGRKALDDYNTNMLFDHYFRHLYTILKFIDQNYWLTWEEQYKYATFVRATLSRYELVMLYYNGFFHKKMKRLMERYCMLNNLRKELLPICYENKCYMTGLGITKGNLLKERFSGGDFEFFLTDNKKDSEKYYLGAFYTREEMCTGTEHLNRWNEYINRKVHMVEYQ